MVMNEYTEGGINARNITLILTSIFHGQYAPVNHLMFLFIYSFVGYNAFYFHLICLMLHISCVCFVNIIIFQLFNQTKREHTHINDKNIRIIAFITALIFAIHPLNVEAVAWISAVKVLNYSFFYLLATLTYLAYLKKENIIYYLLTVLLFALSFGGKEQALTFPVWLLLVYFILGYDLKIKKIRYQLIPFFLLAAFFGFVVINSAGRNEYNVNDLYPLWQRVVFGCYSFVEYVTKFAFPYKLLYIYPYPMASGEPLPSWLLVYPPLILVFFISLKNYLLKKPFVYGILLFLIHIAICLHIVPLSRVAIVADRYIYLALIGLAFIVAYTFSWAIEHWQGWKRNLTISGLICILLYWSVFAHLRSRQWRDSDSIKKEFLEIRKKIVSLRTRPAIPKTFSAFAGSTRNPPHRKQNGNILLNNYFY